MLITGTEYCIYLRIVQYIHDFKVYDSYSIFTLSYMAFMTEISINSDSRMFKMAALCKYRQLIDIMPFRHPFTSHTKKTNFPNIPLFP